MSGALPMRAPLFPIAGAILFPRAQLPLHIFEPRYRELVRDAIDGDGHIAIVQPQLVEVEDDRKQPLYTVGCLGEIAGLEELEDGRFNIVLNPRAADVGVSETKRKADGAKIDAIRQTASSEASGS